MNYIKITTDEVTQGVGLRVTLWLSGCNHHCKECFNPETWNPDAGMLFDEIAAQKIYKELSKPYIQGLTISGGDPLFHNNRKDLLKFILEVKKRFPNKDIWMWTGYTIEELIEQDLKDPMHTVLTILYMIDILVDGEFDISKRDITLEWRGSSNQRIIDTKRTYEEGLIPIYAKDKFGKAYIPPYVKFNIVLWKDGQYK